VIPPRVRRSRANSRVLARHRRGPSTRIFSVDSSHQQIVVDGVAVARGRDHGERDRLGVKRAARGRSPYPAAASLRSVRRDLLSSLARTFGEEARDLACELALECDVFARSPFRCALALTRPRVLVPQALGLGLLDRGHLEGLPRHYRLRVDLARLPSSTCRRRFGALGAGKGCERSC